MNLGFASYHPVTLMVYYGLVLMMAMVLNHPIALGLLWLSVIIQLIAHLGFRKTFFKLRYLWVMVIMIALITPWTNGRGRLPLGTLFGRTITLESLLLGITIGVSLMVVLMVFMSFETIMDDAKVMTVFGRFLPRSTLLIQMTLAFLPKLMRRYQEVRFVSKIQNSKPISRMERIHIAGQTLLTVTGWALEDGMLTADSMTARGYGLMRRSCYQTFAWRIKDVMLLIWCTGLGGILIFKRIGDGLHWQVHRLGLSLELEFNFQALIVLGLLTFTPLILDGKAYVSWRYMQSKI